MKSILKFVMCCGASPDREESHETALGKEETVSFAVPTPLREITRQKSVRRYGPKSVYYPDKKKKYSGCKYWKPSLCSISEDKVTLERRRVSLAGGADQSMEKKKLERSNTSKRAPKTTNQGYVRSYSDNSGRNASQIMPTFSPSPFIF